MRLLRLIAVACCALVVLQAGPAQAEKRVAPGLDSPAPKRSRLAVLLGPIAGAPGDGRTSLKHAIRRQLLRRGVMAVARSASRTYRVYGSIAMSGEINGSQVVIIQWVVKDARGRRLGTVHQYKAIPQGSLDGTWGGTADQIAAGAVAGMMTFLPPP